MTDPDADSMAVDAAVVKKLNAYCEELHRARDFYKETGAPAATVLPLLLEKLSKLRVDVACLRMTGAGKKMNQHWLRRHSDEAVRVAAGSVVDKWKLAIRCSVAHGANGSAACAGEHCTPTSAMMIERATDTPQQSLQTPSRSAKRGHEAIISSRTAMKSKRLKKELHAPVIWKRL